MEAELRDILRAAAAEDEATTTGLGTEIAGLFARVGLGPKESLAELGYKP